MNNEDKRILGIQAAELFGNRHKMRDYPYSGRPPTVDSCIVCGEQGTHMGLKSRYCPIEINWDNAMRLFREVPEAEAMIALVDVCEGAMTADGAHGVIFWHILRHGEPEHLINAAIKAKESQNG